MSDEDFEDVKIPKDLVEKMDEHCKDAGFDSVSDYITYILRQVISKLEGDGDTKEYDKDVERELKNLGYVD